MNFQYWKSRCEAEQQDNTLEARKLVQQADELYEDANLEKAKEIYEQAWERWDVVFETYPLMVADVEGEDVMEAVVRYRDLLSQLDESFPPEGFLLTELLDEYAYDYDIPLAPSGPGEAGPAPDPEEAAEDMSTDAADQQPGETNPDSSGDESATEE